MTCRFREAVENASYPTGWPLRSTSCISGTGQQLSSPYSQLFLGRGVAGVTWFNMLISAMDFALEMQVGGSYSSSEWMYEKLMLVHCARFREPPVQR